MATYSADVAVRITGKEQLDKLEKQLARINRFQTALAKKVELSLNTRNIDAALRRIDNRIRGMSRTITLQVREVRTISYRESGRGSSSSSAAPSNRGGGGGGGVMGSLVSAAAMAGVLARTQRDMTSAIQTTLSQALQGAARPSALGTSASDYAERNALTAMVANDAMRKLQRTGSLDITATTVTVQGRGVTAAGGAPTPPRNGGPVPPGGGGRPPAAPPAGPGGRDPSASFSRQRSAADGLAGALGQLALTYLSVDTAVRAVTSTLQQGIAFDTATAKLKNLSAGFGETAAVMQLTESSASRFGQGITETSNQMAQLYGRLRPLGLSLTEISSVFAGFNTAARLSGSTAAESAGALLQLTQALGSGALRGQELNSVLEQAPLVAQAIAREMNQPIGALKKLAEEGQITSDIVVRALGKIAAEGGPKLAGSLDTSAQAVKNLQNSVERLQIALSKLGLPALLKSLESIGEQVDKGTKFVNNLGDAWSYVATQIKPVLTLYDQIMNHPLRKGSGAIVDFVWDRSGLGVFDNFQNITGNQIPNAVAGLAQKGRDARQQNFIGPAAPQWYGPAPQNTPTTSLQQRLGTTPTNTKDGKLVEEAVRRGVIGGLTGGGQSDASRGSSSGPHLHAQLVRGANLESLVDQALDFGGGRTASSYGLGRGAGPRGPKGHGYPGRDYYTPQGTPFTLKPGWSATDMGIQGALGRGMRVSGPGGAFELGHLQGVQMGDLNGKGAAEDLLAAQQEALNAAIEFQAKQAEQLATSKELLATARLEVTATQAKGEAAAAVAQYLQTDLELLQKYTGLQKAALSNEESENLLQAHKTQRLTNTLALEEQIAEVGKTASQPLADEIKALGDRAAYQREYGALLQQGVLPALADELLKLKQAGELAKVQLDVEIAGVEAMKTKLLAAGAWTEELQKQLDILKGQRDAIAGQVQEGGAQIQDPKQRLQGEYDKIKGELNALTDPVNQVIAGANAIGEAFGQAFAGLVSGSMTAKEALRSFFQSTAQHFIDMASQMIAKYIQMKIIGLALNAFGGAAGGAFSGGTSSAIDTGAGGWGNSFATPLKFAEGGYVTSPTNAIIGEAGESEYVIPSSKMGSAMANYSAGKRGAGVLAAEGGGNGAGSQGGGGGGTFTLETVVINNIEYATVAQVREMGQAAAKQGADGGHSRVMGDFRNKRSVRSRLGVR